LQILTKDNAAVLVGASVQFLIKDPVASKGIVQDLNHSMRVLAQTTLVNIMMTLKLIEIQNDKKFTSIHAQVDTLSNYNLTSVTCEKSTSSLTLPNTTGFLQPFWVPQVVTIYQYGMVLPGSLGRTILN
jgi:hypothetical protein